MSIERNLIRCDQFVCHTELAMDDAIDVPMTAPELPYEIRRWFALHGRVDSREGRDAGIAHCNSDRNSFGRQGCPHRAFSEGGRWAIGAT
jgi:hypothetical protein